LHLNISLLDTQADFYHAGQGPAMPGCCYRRTAFRGDGHEETLSCASIIPLAGLRRSRACCCCACWPWSPRLHRHVQADADGAPADAASRGDADAVRQAIEDGATLEARAMARAAPRLLLATHGNNVDAARELIEAGADVNAKDALQDSAYLYAGARGLDEILAMTLAHGADLRSTNRYGGTALIPAAERGHVATVRTLLRAGVAVIMSTACTGPRCWKRSCSAMAVRAMQIVQLLLEAGADPELADGDGVTPLAHARQRVYRN
jgi:hypothetical protein